jgi:hypothetical protein
MSKCLPLVLISTLLLGLPVASTASASPRTARELNFDVFLDERPIGQQRFALQPTQDGLRVETRASFAVRILRFTAFAYDHRNVEEWRRGCLQSIDSSTDSNGTPYSVSGSLSPEGFVVSGSAGARRLDACVGTFSYWDRGQLIDRKWLLNSQTGEYVAVTAESLGAGTLSLGEREVAVERWVLRGRNLEITLAYAARDGEWLALDSELEGGRKLRYRRSAAELAGVPRASSSARAASASR